MISLHSADNGVCRYVSPACLALLGYTTDEMMQIDYSQLIHNENRNSIQEEVKQLVSSFNKGKNLISPSIQQVFRVRRKEGTFIWVERVVKVLKYPSMQLSLAVREVRY